MTRMTPEQRSPRDPTYTTPENSHVLKLTQGKFCIVDEAKVDVLKKFKWRAVQAKSSWYAKADIFKNGLHFTISMHRFLARTPWGMVCHHKNGNSLDNRIDNLENMSKIEHNTLHANNKIRIKYEQPHGNG